MSLMQAAVLSTREAFASDDGNSMKGPAEAPGPKAALLQLCTGSLQAGAAMLRLPGEALLSLPDPEVAGCFLGVALIMGIAAFVLVVRPELVKYNRLMRTGASGYRAATGETSRMEQAPGDAARNLETAGDRELGFCPELVVPHDCFCTLIMPIKPLKQGPSSVTGVDGTPVLQVLPHAEAPEERNEQEGTWGGSSVTPLLSLVSQEGSTLAYCGRPTSSPSVTGGLPAELMLLKADGDIFGMFALGQAHGQYVLLTNTGAQFYFLGSHDCRTILVRTGKGKQVAEIKMYPTGDYCCMKVEPATDAGLILCSLLCITHIGAGAANCAWNCTRSFDKCHSDQ